LYGFAQEPEFVATVSKTTVAVGEPFQVRFTLNTSGKQFTPPNFKDFRVLSGPNQSTSMQFINGQMSSEISIGYSLLAVKEGTFVIEPAKISVGSDVLITQPIKITVVQGANSQQNPANNNAGTSTTGTNDEISDVMFIQASVNKTNVYQGEQLTATYKLYTRASIVGNDLVKFPELNGFWNEDIEIDNQWRTEIYNGQKWNVATIKKVVLFPTRSGNLEIDPLIMTFTVRQRSSGQAQSLWDQFFGRVEDKDYTLSTKPIKIHVKPLPQPAPESFNGAVGNFQLEAKVNKTEVTTNDAIDLSVKIKGTGNINLVENVQANFPQDFEVYDPKITDNISVTPGGVSGTKEFKYLIIPRYAGNFTIEPIEFSYFDTKTKKYVTLKSDPFEIKVEKGTGENSVAFNGNNINKEDVKILGNDIQFIHTNAKTLKPKESIWFGTLKHYVLLLISIVLLAGGFVYKKHLIKSQADVVGANRKKAAKIAHKYLKEAKKAIKDEKAFHDALAKALYNYVSYKLNINTSELTNETITEKLKTADVQENTIKELNEIIANCEMARYAPVHNFSNQELLSKAEQCIQKVESEFKV
jgi:hypothetical protein